MKFSQYCTFIVFVVILSFSTSVTLHAQCDGQATFTDDRDGQVYNQVTIGTQCWMAENLNFGTHVVVSIGGQDPAGTQKYCTDVSGNNDSSCPTGGLYEWNEMMNGAASCNGTGAPPNDRCGTFVQGICPDGWHVPSHYEVTTLERNVGNSPGSFPYDETTLGWLGTNEGANMKVTPICGTLPCFKTPNTGATNSSGLSLVPTSFSFNGNFDNLGGEIVYFWTSTQFNATDAWYRAGSYLGAGFKRDPSTKALGFGVRCIRDVAAWPLPVELLYFDANWLNDEYEIAEITWETQSEINNSHFEIERSTDGIHFEYLKTVQGKGDNNQNSEYQTLDEDPYTDDVSYYRLKQVDLDGKYQYSQIEALNVPEGLTIVNLYPNPALSQFTMLLTSSQEDNVMISIKNNLGQELRRLERDVQEGFNSFDFDVSELSTGNYFVEITTTSGLYKIERKFMKGK